MTNIEPGMLCEIVVPEARRGDWILCAGCGKPVFPCGSLHGSLCTTERRVLTAFWLVRIDGELPPTVHHVVTDLLSVLESWLRPLPPPEMYLHREAEEAA